MEDIYKDERFKYVGHDPKYRNISKFERKVKIDKRFQSMFTDKRFQLKYQVDKRGRPTSETQTENYKKYYELSDGEEESKVKVKGSVFEVASIDEDTGERDESAEERENDRERPRVKESKVPTETDEEFKQRILKKTKANEGDTGSEDETDQIDRSKLTEKMKSRLFDMTMDCARGVGTVMSEESSSDESSSDESDSEFIEHPWGELDRDAETTDEVTNRFAVCNMDWDRITATDLMVLFNSFLPNDGIIESVSIYPSEFGLERLKEEEIQGPKELIELKAEGQDDEKDDGTDGISKEDKYIMEKLREYQLKRLKYYYGVVVFNNADVANKVYTECDGMEFESSATKLDLRFIPDEMEFEQEPREVCTSLPDPAKYKPRLFANTALQQGRVDLTWDETDPNRVDFTKKIAAGEEINDEVLKEFIATSSCDDSESEPEEASKSDSGSEEDEKDRITKYRSLVASLEENTNKKKKGDVEMEITWGTGLQEKTDSIIREKQKSEMSHFEKIVDKKVQKSRQRHGKAKESDDDNLCSDDELPSDVDLNDPYFKNEVGTSKSSMKKQKDKTTKLTPEELAEQEKQKAELELLLADDEVEEVDKRHFNLKSIQEQEASEKKKKKWRKQLKKKKVEPVVEDNFKIDVSDERFSALYESHHFNIDPSDPHFRKTKAMEELIKEKQKRKTSSGQQVGESKRTKISEEVSPELTRLVESIKRKTKPK